MEANQTITGILFAKHAASDGGDFEWFVNCRRKSGQWTEIELALSIKDRIPDARIEGVLHDMATVAA